MCAIVNKQTTSNEAICMHSPGTIRLKKCKTNERSRIGSVHTRQPCKYDHDTRRIKDKQTRVYTYMYAILHYYARLNVKLYLSTTLLFHMFSNTSMSCTVILSPWIHHDAAGYRSQPLKPMRTG